MAASREEVYERVKEVLTEQLGIDEADITEEASFQDQDLGRGRPEDPDRRAGRRLRRFAPVAADSDLAQLIDALPPELAEPVFTHTSWASERADSYERLEFLGDSVLELAVAHALYARHPDFSEGKLAKVRSHVVSRATCAEVAQKLGLGARLVERVDSTQTVEELERLSLNRNVLAAVIEAALERYSSSTASRRSRERSSTHSRSRSSTL
jgi:dsRNA-specific ribonuclease